MICMHKIVSLIVCMWVWNVFQVSNSCSMDLGCPLLRGLSDRRLRRCASTNVVIYWKKTLLSRRWYLITWLLFQPCRDNRLFVQTQRKYFYPQFFCGSSCRSPCSLCLDQQYQNCTTRTKTITAVAKKWVDASCHIHIHLETARKWFTEVAVNDLWGRWNKLLCLRDTKDSEKFSFLNS